MKMVFLILQSTLFGFVAGLQFPITTHTVELFALVALNSILTVAYGVTRD